MKFLFFGFSVTEDASGYAKRINTEHDVISVGIGGIQPNHAKYFVNSILKIHKPEIVALEIGTAPFRKWTTPEKYLESLICLLSSIIQNDAMPVLVDFPRRDTYGVNDWVESIHKKVSKRLGFPHFSFFNAIDPQGIEINQILRDEVHTTTMGAEMYAKLLSTSIEKWAEIRKCYFDMDEAKSILKSTNHASAFELGELIEGLNLETFKFARAGFSCSTSLLKPGHSIELRNLRHLGEFTGFSYILGPQSGYLSYALDRDSQVKSINCYDQFCYYKRFGVIELAPRACDDLRIEQLAEIPQIKLLKGSPNLGERMGELVHVLFSDPFKRSLIRDLKLFQELLH